MFKYHDKTLDLENKVMDLEIENRKLKKKVSQLQQNEKYLVKDITILLDGMQIKEKEKFILSGHTPVEKQDRDYISLLKNGHIICFVNTRIKTMIYYTPHSADLFANTFGICSIYFDSENITHRHETVERVFMFHDPSIRKYFANPDFLLADGDRVIIYKNERNLLQKMKRHIFNITDI